MIFPIDNKNVRSSQNQAGSKNLVYRRHSSPISIRCSKLRLKTKYSSVSYFLYVQSPRSTCHEAFRQDKLMLESTAKKLISLLVLPPCISTLKPFAISLSRFEWICRYLLIVDV